MELDVVRGEGVGQGCAVLGAAQILPGLDPPALRGARMRFTHGSRDGDVARSSLSSRQDRNPPLLWAEDAFGLAFPSYPYLFLGSSFRGINQGFRF